MAVDRGGRIGKRVPKEKLSEQKQIEMDIYRAIPQHASRESVIKALLSVLDKVAKELFAEGGAEERE